MVKAVDIIQHPAEHEHAELFTRSFVSSVGETSSGRTASPLNESSTHEYTVPLNDTQPRQGPTLLQQLKAMQFYGAPSPGDPWSNGANHANDSHSSIQSNGNEYPDHSEDITNMTTSSAGIAEIDDRCYQWPIRSAEYRRLHGKRFRQVHNEEQSFLSTSTTQRA